MQALIRLCFYSVSICVLTGCVLLPPQVKDLQSDIYEIKVQVQRLQTLQGDTHKLLSARISEENEKEKARYSNLRQDQADLERRIKDLQEQVRQLQSLLEEIRFRLQEGSSITGDKIRASGQREQNALSSDILITEQGDTIDGKALLDSSRLFFSNGKYDQAREALTRYLKYFSSSPKAQQALFLLADTHYYQEDYQQAENLYLRLARDYPSGNRVADSLVKAAVCQINLDRKKTALNTLRKILEDYPRYHDLHRVQSLLNQLEEPQ